MNIEIQTRHFNMSDEQRELIDERLARLDRFSPRQPISVRLKVTREGSGFIADLVYALKNSDFRSRHDATEPEFAAEGAVESIIKQLQRHKGKISARQKGESGGLGKAALMDGSGLLETSGSVLEAEGFRLRDLDVQQAMEAFRTSDHPFFVFRNIETSRVNVVYQRDDGELGMLESEES